MALRTALSTIKTQARAASGKLAAFPAPPHPHSTISDCSCRAIMAGMMETTSPFSVMAQLSMMEKAITTALEQKGAWPVPATRKVVVLPGADTISHHATLGITETDSLVGVVLRCAALQKAGRHAPWYGQ